MDTYQDFDFPAEIRCQPQPLVAFINLNVAGNVIHKNIWEMFTNNRNTDRVPMEFLLLSADFVLPILKPKVTTILFSISCSFVRDTCKLHFFILNRGLRTNGTYLKVFSKQTG